MVEYCLITPLDVLYLRGNRLFGGAGSHSESLMPPWPSVAAGALRSPMLSEHNLSFSNFAKGERPAGILGEVIGTPENPGTFRVACFTLGMKAGLEVEMFFPLPADLVVEGSTVHYVEPNPMNEAVLCSYPLPFLPVLKATGREKPESGIWLNARGLRTYIKGKDLNNSQWVNTNKLWQSAIRLGIGMDPAKRTTEQGRIYTSDTVALAENVGFLVGIDGAEGLLPASGFLRFGGDGRGSVVNKCTVAFPEPPWDEIVQTGCFRLILSTPGLFPGGWLPPGNDWTSKTLMWSMNGCKARLVAASIGRPEVVSGWDLARDRPKKAQRAVPAGAVYWFDHLEGDISGLKKLVKEGLWNDDQLNVTYRQRRAEGFNNVFVAPWHNHESK